LPSVKIAVGQNGRRSKWPSVKAASVKRPGTDFIKEIESQNCVVKLCKTKNLSKILFLRYWPVNRSYNEKYQLRLCSNKWSNWFLLTLKVSKILRYAKFTIKNLII
jgi:hypothetical protein